MGPQRACLTPRFAGASICDMTAEPRWVPEALDDLQSGYDWYEQRQPGLGRRLAVEVFATLDMAVRNPMMARKMEHPSLPRQPEVRRVGLRRFDEYGVVYTVLDGTFWILAIAHSKRQPGCWLDKLERLT